MTWPYPHAQAEFGVSELPQSTDVAERAATDELRGSPFDKHSLNLKHREKGEISNLCPVKLI